MLILSRRAGEAFFVGEDVEIIILETRGDKVKIGINAPPQVNLARSELKETQKANLAAASIEPGLVLDSLNKYICLKKI